uniref:Putative secreted protein n=1 Tax=Anopheles marajoara TaxID=58244 RepID=A0A2M4CBA4_9DIPT
MCPFSTLSRVKVSEQIGQVWLPRLLLLLLPPPTPTAPSGPTPDRFMLPLFPWEAVGHRPPPTPPAAPKDDFMRRPPCALITC